jgi:uncharacterized protein YbjT (DUF2867 family)
MADRKILTVFGATGAQGGGLARAILADPASEFTVRAVTRNPQSDKAKALADMGAEVVQADLDDQDSVNKAMEGAHSAFCVTFYWEHMSPDKEKAHAAAMASAAAKAGVEHVVWSTFEDTRDMVPVHDDRMPTLMDNYKVPHFDAKAEANDFFTDRGVPTTFLLTSFYWDNFIHFGLGPKKGEDGKWAITMPLGERKMPGIAAEDIGKCAYGIFKRGSEMIGKTIGLSGQHLSGAEMAAGLTAVVGEPVQYNAVPAEVFRSFGFPGADDMGNMFQFKHDFEDLYRGNRDVESARELNPDLMSFDQWIAKYGKQIPLD